MKLKQTHTFNFDFNEIIKDDLLLKESLMKEFSSDLINEYFEKTFSLLKEKSLITAGYVFYDSDKVKLLTNKIYIDGQLFEIGKIIYRGIKEIDSTFIYVCTIGVEIEKCIWKYFDDGFSLEGYLLDKMASELVEISTDYLQVIIEQQAIEIGKGFSNRYSPGYCGWSVNEQQKLFKLLPKNFCGVNLTSSSLMIPIKSVSGLIAAGSKLTKREYECEICDDNFCYKKKVL